MSATPPEQLYETDFYAWTQAQARELRRFARARPNLPLDLAHIAEEIHDLGKSERDAVFSLAQQILQHLLLIEHSPAIDQRLHWADEIDEFRDRIERKLSPTIRRQLKRSIGEVYAAARRRVQRATANGRQPPRCPRHAPTVLSSFLATGSRIQAAAHSRWGEAAGES
jgi:hypothetical protein